MVVNLVKQLVGSANERYLKRLGKNVDAINALEPDLEALSDADLRTRTETFRRRISDGETPDDLLVEAFATVREAAKRTLGQRHFDVHCYLSLGAKANKTGGLARPSMLPWWGIILR